MKITHEVYRFQIINFTKDSFKVGHSRHRTSPIELTEWREYSGLAQIYSSGKVVVHGFDILKYYSHLSGLGYQLSPITLVSRSASHKLKQKVSYQRLVEEHGCLYEPELFNACSLYVGKAHLLIFHTGSVVITGLHPSEESSVLGFLLELEL